MFLIHYFLPTFVRSEGPFQALYLFSGVSRTLNLALDVVSFAEESEPVVQHLLVLV